MNDGSYYNMATSENPSSGIEVHTVLCVSDVHTHVTACVDQYRY